MNINAITERYWSILEMENLPRLPLNEWNLDGYIQRVNNQGSIIAYYWLRDQINPNWRFNRPGSPEIGFGKVIYTGPNGGRFYLKSGRKVYFKK